jgi:hypothetical protein
MKSILKIGMLAIALNAQVAIASGDIDDMPPKDNGPVGIWFAPFEMMMHFFSWG